MLEPYLRAIDQKPVLGAAAEFEGSHEVRNLRRAYWAELLSNPQLHGSIAATARTRLEGVPPGTQGLVDAISDVDVSCDLADQILADLLSDESTDAEFVRAVQRRRLAWLAARRRFAASNLRLVLTLAGRYRWTGFLPFADLVQEGNVGLLLAVDRFDPRRGFRFSTYATWWIKHAITRALSTKGRPVRLPANVLELRAKVRRFRDEFERTQHRSPSLPEIAEGLDVPLKKVEQLGRVMLTQEVAPRGRRSVPGAVDALDEVAADADDPAERIDAGAVAVTLRRGLDALPSMEREILNLRFGLDGGDGRTLREVGEHFSLSRERIRQLQVRALDRLRAVFHAEGRPSPFAAAVQ